jgi:hypothetical protein
MANHKGPDFTMNHSIIGRALLLGACWAASPMPKPKTFRCLAMQNTPLKSAKKPAHHSSTTQRSQGARKQPANQAASITQAPAMANTTAKKAIARKPGNIPRQP